MAFDVAGIGGTFAAGLLEGQASAQKQREVLKAQREKDYLKTYTDLIKSGEWEPVEDFSKGVEDGGVLRVGNIGYLKQRKSGGISALDFQRLQAGKLSEAKREQLGKKLTITEIPVPQTIKGPDGEDVTIKYVQKVAVDQEGNIVKRLGPPAPAFKESPQTWKTYIDESGKPIHLPKGTRPPEGTIPASAYLSGERLNLSKVKTQADEYESKAKEAAKRVAKLEMYSRLPAPAEENLVKKAQDDYVKASGDVAENIVRAQAIKDGKSPVEARELGQRARQEAEAEAYSKIGQAPVEEAGPIDKVYDSIIEIGGDLEAKFAKALSEVKELLQIRKNAKLADENFRRSKALKKSGKKIGKEILQQAPKKKKKSNSTVENYKKTINRGVSLHNPPGFK